MNPCSRRRRLLLWVLLATAILGLLALIDTRREAMRKAQGVLDRVLFGPAPAIAERVSVSEAGGLDADLPYASLEMLTSAAQDKVFCRVDDPVDSFLTGYKDRAIIAAPAGGVGFADGVHDGVNIPERHLDARSINGRGAVVTVRVGALANGPLLQVEDNGPGHSQAQIRAVTQLGHAAPRPTPQIANRQPIGMGLELAIAFEIAKQFKAKLRFARPESGTGPQASIDFWTGR